MGWENAIKQALHSQRVTVWCTLISGGVIAPYFFEITVGQIVALNGIFGPELHIIIMGDIWFQ